MLSVFRAVHDTLRSFSNLAVGWVGTAFWACRRSMAALALASVAAGLAVVVPMPLTVQATAPTPGIITTYAGGGLGEGLPITIGQNALALAVLGTTLYIADPAYVVVRAVNLSANPLNEIVVAGNGVAGSTGDGGQATAAEIQSPGSLAVNASGDLFIATSTTYKNDPSNLIRRLDHSTGVITTYAGGGSAFADNVAATATSISGVPGMSFDTAGNLVIADSFNDRVRKIDHTSGLINTVAGTGNPVYQGDGIPATSANITFPGSVAVDSSDNILITSFDARLLKVDHTSGLISTVAGNGQNYTASGCPTGPATGPLPGGALSLDGSGNPMLVGYNCVTKIVSGNYSTVAGNGSLGYSGDGAPRRRRRSGSLSIPCPMAQATSTSRSGTMTLSVASIIRPSSSARSRVPVRHAVAQATEGRRRRPRCVLQIQSPVTAGATSSSRIRPSKSCARSTPVA